MQEQQGHVYRHTHLNDALAYPPAPTAPQNEEEVAVGRPLDDGGSSDSSSSSSSDSESSDEEAAAVAAGVAAATPGGRAAAGSSAPGSEAQRGQRARPNQDGGSTPPSFRGLSAEQLRGIARSRCTHRARARLRFAIFKQHLDVDAWYEVRHLEA